MNTDRARQSLSDGDTKQALQGNSDADLVLRAQNVSKRYSEGRLHVDVLSDVSLDIIPGERVAIIGSSGSGKSTLLHLLGGLDSPTSGKIFIAGQDPNQMSQTAKGKLRNLHIGFVYQFHHLLAELSAVENVAMPLLIRGKTPGYAKEHAAELLDRVGLGQRLQHKPAELSGGERQRAAIARALVTRPSLVLADEPTGNLDESTADKVYELMLELNQELGTSFLLVTHDSRLAARMQRVLRLSNGELIAESE